MKTEQKTSGKTVQLNIDVPESVRRDLKIVAAMRGQPLKQVLTVALVEFSKESMKNGGKDTMMALWVSRVRFAPAPPLSAGSKGTCDGVDVLPVMPGPIGVQDVRRGRLRRRATHDA